MESPKFAGVVIVGGGVMGASTAYHLALKGYKNVVLLERNSLFGQEATGKCAGGIRYQFSTEINIRLSILSLPMLDRFEEELGQAIDLRRCGYLFLLTRKEDVKAFRASLTLHHRIDFARNVYFHREGPSILTGMSNFNEPPSFNRQVDPQWELVHFDAGMARIPLLENVGISSRWEGLYEVTPDAHPILGKVSEVEGFYCINGFSGHGRMHSPACGLLLAEEILDGKAHTLDITSLRLSRFREGELIHEYNVV